MQAYHASNSLSSGGYPDTGVRNSRIKNPYAYEVIPPIGRLLELICEERSVGGCFRPGNRALARRMGYAGASQIPYLLSQLACDGWISYDPLSGVIMLLRTPDDRSIGSIDRVDQDAAESGAIDRIDRDLPRSDAADLCDRSPEPTESACMVLATASTHESSQDLAVSYGGMQGGDKQSAGGSYPRDRPPPAAQLMAELGANPKIIRAAYTARPDWTPQHVRDRWEYDQRRIAASDGRLTAGIFFTALRSGELAPDTRPIDPQAYAGRDDVMLGSDPPPEGTIRDRALTLAGNPTAETLGSYARDVVFLQCRLGMGDSDADALHALEKHRTRVRR